MYTVDQLPRCQVVALARTSCINYHRLSFAQALTCTPDAWRLSSLIAMSHDAGFLRDDGIDGWGAPVVGASCMRC